MSDLPPPPTPPGSMPPAPPPPPGWGAAPPAPGAPNYSQPGYGAPGYAPGYGYPPVRPPYASFGMRLGGKLLDWLLYGLVYVPFIVVGTVILLAGPSHIDSCPGDEPGLCEIPDAVSWVGFGVLALAGFAVVAVLYIRALARRGQTWGKKIVGIKVVGKDDGQVIGVGRAIGRTLFETFISGNLCYLGYLWMLWDKDNQTWHDKVVGSIVIEA